MSKFDYLTASEISSIKEVIGGADVLSLIIAKELRSVDKKQKLYGHKLIDITPVMGDYKVTESLPYFGCFVFTQGIKAVEELA